MSINETIPEVVARLTAERDAARLALAEAQAREVWLRAALIQLDRERMSAADCEITERALAAKPDLEALREFGRRCVALERTRTSWGEESDVVDGVLRGET